MYLLLTVLLPRGEQDKYCPAKLVRLSSLGLSLHRHHIYDVWRLCSQC